MIIFRRTCKFNWFLIIAISTFFSCGTGKQALTPATANAPMIDIKKSSGGSSGMEQLNDSTYIIVYDTKSPKPGVRIGLVRFSDNSIDVFPIHVPAWDAEDKGNDLESICRIPGTKNEFLACESGDWQGNPGQVYHLRLDMENRSATVLGSFYLPLMKKNDIGLVGDQYEAIYCLPFGEESRIILLGERGGSEAYPNGIIRWGYWDMYNEMLSMEGPGIEGVSVKAPGNWNDPDEIRSITDFHVDGNNVLWASMHLSSYMFNIHCTFWPLIWVMQYNV